MKHKHKYPIIRFITNVKYVCEIQSTIIAIEEVALGIQFQVLILMSSRLIHSSSSDLHGSLKNILIADDNTINRISRYGPKCFG